MGKERRAEGDDVSCAHTTRAHPQQDPGDTVPLCITLLIFMLQNVLAGCLLYIGRNSIFSDLPKYIIL